MSYKGGELDSHSRTGIERYVAYRMDGRLLAASLAVSATTFAIYAQYFDILVPFIPGGSVRVNSGLFFVLPITLLLSAQTLFATWITHMVVGAAAPEKKDALKAYFVAAVEIFLFSVFYAFFPYYGPYTFIVYFMPGASFGPDCFPLLVGWTLVTIVGSALLTRRTFGLPSDERFGTLRNLLFAAAILALIMVTAS